MTVRLRCSQCRRTAEHPYSLVNGLEPNSSELRDQMRARGWAFNSQWIECPLTLCPACFAAYQAKPEPSHPLPPPPARAERQERLKL